MQSGVDYEAGGMILELEVVVVADSADGILNRWLPCHGKSSRFLEVHVSTVIWEVVLQS